MGRRAKKTAWGLVLLAAAATAVWWMARPAVTYDTAPVGRGDVESSVTAVGKLQPRRYVDVGAQVSGQILRLHVQAGDAVKKGQLLAEIDPSVQKATVDAGRASLSGLRAQLAEQQAQHVLASRQIQRQRELNDGGATRTEDVDVAESNLAQAAARVDNLKAQIAQTSASLQADEVRLGYTSIFATMDGTVVSVDAREGQTLNATYQTPNIMRIADLGRMTVWTEVSEAEVRKVRAGMPVYFTTLGADRRRWHGEVRQVLPAPPSPEGKSTDTALAPSSNKVIVYTALFDVDNADGELMPQMTAQVSFVAASARDVLVAPLAALKPVKPADPVSPEALVATGAVNGAAKDTKDSKLQPPAGANHGMYTARVLDADGRVQERRVRAGVRNRVSAEVLEGLKEGERIITGEHHEESALRRFQL